MLKKAVLQIRDKDCRVRCGTCIRRCSIPKGRYGFCRNYKNVDGVLYNVGYGKISAIESRPIEVKPLFHFYPGSSATTFSGWGCNFTCPWCQNWHLSKYPPPEDGKVVPPEDIIKFALRWGDEGVCASFNEPIIHLEYLLDVFSEAKKHGLYTVIVSNASMTYEALLKLADAGLDAISADIKGCPETYRRFQGIPDPTEILRNLSKAIDLGVHVEAVYLVVTGANDWDECIDWVIDNHLKYLGPDVPLHVNRYYPAYEYTKPATSIDLLFRIYEEAIKSGIKYVYVGNIASIEYMNTKCPNCGKVVIRRVHYGVIDYRLGDDGRCPYCGYRINVVGKGKVSKYKLFI